MYTFIHSIYFTIKQILKTRYYFDYGLGKRMSIEVYCKRSQHLPALPHRVCISPTAVVLCYSSELPTPVLVLPTTLHTLQMLPPYLLKDGFIPRVLPLGFISSNTD